MSARPAFSLDARGFVFAWYGPLGPMLARYAAWSSLSPELARGLGHPGADLPVVPELLVGDEGVLAVWCEEDGAWSSHLAHEDGAERGPSLVLPGAERIALAGGRDGGLLFGADGEGIRAVPLDAHGRPSGEPTRHVSETRAPPRLVATRVRGEHLCVAVHPGEKAWTSLHVAAGRGTAVRHRHRAPVEDARVRTVGGRAAVVFEAGGTVELALISASGKVVERPHEVFPVGTGALASPDAVWVDDHWVVLARDVEAGVVRGHPLVAKGTAFTLPATEGPFAVVYRSQTYYVLEVDPVDDEAELRLWRCDKRGDGQQRRVDRVPNPHARALKQRRAIRHSLEALADTMRRARGYRDSAVRPALGREGATLELVDDHGRLSVSARPDPESDALAMRVASALGDEVELPEAPSSLVRLAAWVRARLSPSARDVVEARAAWAAALAEGIGAQVERVDRAGPSLVLELRLAELPHAEALQRWLRRLRDAQRDAP